MGVELRDGGYLELKLLAVAHICEPILNSAIDKDQYPHLKCLNFASELTHSVNQMFCWGQTNIGLSLLVK